MAKHKRIIIPLIILACICTLCTLSDDYKIRIENTHGRIAREYSLSPTKVHLYEITLLMNISSSHPPITTKWKMPTIGGGLINVDRGEGISLTYAPLMLDPGRVPISIDSLIDIRTILDCAGTVRQDNIRYISIRAYSNSIRYIIGIKHRPNPHVISADDIIVIEDTGGNIIRL